MLDVGRSSLYTIQDLMDGLGMSKSTLYMLMDERGLMYCKPGKQRIVRGSDLLDFMEKFTSDKDWPRTHRKDYRK